MVFLAVGLYRNYEPASARAIIPLTGISLQLGEVEGGNGEATTAADRERDGD